MIESQLNVLLTDQRLNKLEDWYYDNLEESVRFLNNRLLLNDHFSPAVRHLQIRLTRSTTLGTVTALGTLAKTFIKKGTLVCTPRGNTLQNNLVRAFYVDGKHCVKISSENCIDMRNPDECFARYIQEVISEILANVKFKEVNGAKGWFATKDIAADTEVVQYRGDGSCFDRLRTAHPSDEDYSFLMEMKDFIDRSTFIRAKVPRMKSIIEDINQHAQQFRWHRPLYFSSPPLLASEACVMWINHCCHMKSSMSDSKSPTGPAHTVMVICFMRSWAFSAMIRSAQAFRLQLSE